MSGPTNEGSPPPEVPEEFAAAYRAAYERALAAQTGGPQHRVDPEPEPESDDTAETPIPPRRGPLRVGTHRSQQDHDVPDEPPTLYERVRDSRWFVPVLLALLALLLIIGAYAVGRRFADRVHHGGSSAEAPGVVTPDGAGKGTPQLGRAG